MPDRASPVLLSIHDVMPSTLPQVSALLDLLAQTGAGPADLLVVPGLDWRPDQIETLAAWHRAGHRLAGHGWCHRARHIRGWRHRLHSVLISRDVAEHLALDRTGIADLIRRCHGWFEAHDLPSPSLYVPPAWAMGGMSRRDLAALPFDRYEVLTGLLERDDDGPTVRWRPVPMIGFEADTPWRAAPVRLWNVLNRGHAAFWRTPLRVAIHPHDLSLALGGALRRTLRDLTCGRAEGHDAAPGPDG
jgi:predicted deacetylase